MKEARPTPPPPDTLYDGALVEIWNIVFTVLFFALFVLLLGAGAGLLAIAAAGTK